MISKTHTFTVDIKSEVDDTHYRGNFTVKRLSVADNSALRLRKTQLCGGFYCVRDEDGNPTGKGMDAEAEFNNYAIAYLETAIQSAPPWWNLDEIADEEVIFKVFKEAFEWENSFRNRGKKANSRPSGEGDSEKEHSETNGGSSPKKMVDKQVQASLEP